MILSRYICLSISIATKYQKDLRYKDLSNLRNQPTFNGDWLPGCSYDPCVSKMQLQGLVFFVNLFCWFSETNGINHLQLFPGLQCNYNYDFEVHAHRGKRSTKELNFKINTQVCYIRYVSHRLVKSITLSLF